MMGLVLAIKPLASVKVAKGVVEPAWNVWSLPAARGSPSLLKN
jgi:hypothetical protein